MMTGMQLWGTLSKIQSVSGVSNEEMAEIMGLSWARFGQLAVSHGFPPVDSLHRLAEHFKISLDSIVTDTVDYALLYCRAQGDREALPDQYRDAAFSKRRTSANILGYLERHHGWWTKNSVLRHFNLSDSAFLDQDKMISIRFLSDLSEYLHRCGWAESDFYRMGQYSYVTNRNTPVEASLKGAVDPIELFARVLDGFLGESYDRNHIYSLERLTRSHCVIGVRPHPLVTDALGARKFGNRLVCIARGGVFSSMTNYIGLPAASVTEPHCIHNGDESCRYVIDFSSAAAQSDATAPQRHPLRVVSGGSGGGPGSA